MTTAHRFAIVSTVLLSSALWLGRCEAQSGDSTRIETRLEASTAPAWKPPTPIGSEQPWETALRLPLRVATLPLSLVGMGLEGALVYAEENSLVPRIGVLIATIPKIGVTLTPASLGDGTGLGASVGVRPKLFRRILGAQLSGSLERYTRTRVDLEAGPALLAYSYDWRPREHFFGFGMSSAETDESSYALRTQTFQLGLAYPWRKGNEARPREQIRVWGGPREAILRRGREDVSFEDQFTEVAHLLNQRQEQIRFGLGISTDRRAGKPHWSRGGRATLEIERFNDITSKTLAIRSPRGDSPDFTRLSVEAEGGVSFRRDPNTIRLGLRVVDQSGDAESGRLLLSDLMSLGGSRALAGFEPGRFHDIDLVAGKLTYLFPLSRNLEFEMHAEAGAVYPDLERARFDALETSYGVALRPRIDAGALASIGVDWTTETVRIRYSFGGIE